MRLEKTLKNFIWSLLGQLVLILSGLVLKKILLDTIGTEKVGLNYVFNDLVGLLSIAELGITNIIAYHLYKPLLTGDERMIIQIMRFFRKIYFFIGTTVIVLGFCLIPFLGMILGDTALDYDYIIIIFLLFLLRDTEGYFFSYKSILPYADQSSYLVMLIDTISLFVHTVLSVFVILYTREFIYVMLLEIVRKILRDMIINSVVDRRYPYIRQSSDAVLLRSETVKIRKEIFQVFIGKASDLVITTSDNILITMFLGLRTTGLFSNYTLVIYTVQTMLRQLLSSAQASIGNLLAADQRETIHSVVRKLTFIAFYIGVFCACCLYQLTTPFVAIYFGEQYTLERLIVLICVCNVFLDTLQRAMIQLADAGGLFRQTKIINFTSCITNVILSLIGVRFLGVAGILLGTLISRGMEFLLRIVFNFRLILITGGRRYLKTILIYVIIFIVEMGIVDLFCRFCPFESKLLQFAMFGLISALVPVLLNHLMFRRSEEYTYMRRIFLRMLRVVFRRDMELPS